MQKSKMDSKEIKSDFHKYCADATVLTDKLKKYSDLDEDTLFILVSQTMPDAGLIQVSGRFGEPFVHCGEFCIISSENSIDSNHGKLCYIRHKAGINIGIITVCDQNRLSVMGNEALTLVKEDVMECRRIKWIQKK